MKQGEWVLAEDGSEWVEVETPAQADGAQPPDPDAGKSTNIENDDMDGFHYREPEAFEYEDIPLYDEITYLDLDGNEVVKYVSPDSPKVRHPLSSEKKDVSKKENTFVKAETYFEAVQKMQPGEIYVSDVTGAYVGSNYIGMYTPDNVATAAADRGYNIEYDPEGQSYAGKENPNGERFEGIVRWATPVAGEDGEVAGYVTFALNHDHIMEFVDHLTPMNERYTELPSAFEGNYAFIWDYQCRSICHPRHNSIVGFDAETGDPQIPWLESSIYDAWQESGVEKWNDFIVDWPTFDGQSRDKTPAPTLTQAGLVGLDGRYLNNAPQCTGWMDLTQDGGSGSFYILWSGLYKLTTAAAIPYYTGQYAPSEENDFSRRGFGFVAIGAGLEDFTAPATEMETKLTGAIDQNTSNTIWTLVTTTAIIVVLVVLIAIWMASSLTGNITYLIRGISRFRAGERQFRFNAPVKNEFGTLADSFDDMANSIVDSVKNPLCIIDKNRIVLYMNEPGLEFTRMTLDEIVGTRYADSSVYPADSKYDPLTALEQDREAEIFHDEASGHYLRGSASYFLGRDGENVGYIIETADVTAMVEEQLKLEEQRTLLDRIFSASPDLIWYMDSAGRYLTVNPRFAAIAGRDPEEFTGKTAERMLPAEIAGVFAKSDIEAIDTAAPVYTEESITFADGHAEVLDAVRTPLYDPNGALAGVLGFARNVSQRVAIENELRTTQNNLEEAVREANKANLHKGEFLARMSHEIRTPMNAIIGVTGIVERKLDDLEKGTGGIDEVRTYLDQIEISSQHLLGLLNDILDISKIDAGKIELSEEMMELPKLAATVNGIIKPRCDEKNIAYITQCDAFENPTFLGDSLRLRQVLINLLGNAVKFTPECGTIEFIIENKERRAGETLVGFTVRDTGIGVSEEQAANIFEAFEQGGGNVSRNYGGTGLGLAISQRIVELFGGKIQLHSVLGEGSAFSFSIWLKESEERMPEAENTSNIAGRFAGKRMLLVDDVDINRMIVATMLDETGFEVDEAADGREALDLFEASAPGGYDVILMDVQMPVMDGYQASKAIRALDRPDAKSVPIIALTANAFKEDMDKALQSGMNAHVAKPVEMDTLMEVLLRLL